MRIEVPHGVWQVVDAATTLFTRAYMLARTRAASHASPIVRLLAGRDQAHLESQLLDREIAILKAQRSQLAAHSRPQYRPEQRSEILQLMLLRGWSAEKAAQHFVVHPNTIRAWRKEARGDSKTSRLLPSPPWNKFHDGIRWLVHEIRKLCPEREFGTRTIARHILRAGIQISRTSVRRILHEEPPEDPAKKEPPALEPEISTGSHLLKPETPNRVWHLDFTSVHFLWVHLRIAALVDGFSRKLLALRVYPHAPTTPEMLRLVNRAVRREGKPRFLITDHGGQFQGSFEDAIQAQGTTLVQGHVGCFKLNAKVERLFRTLKIWQRVSLLALNTRSIQKKLTSYRLWYNRHRPHGALGVLTPDEKAADCKPPETTAIRAVGEVEPLFRIRRENLRGDPRLPVMSIRLELHKRAA